MPVLQSVHPGLRTLVPPGLARVRQLAERCGVRDGALRTALSRACAAGSLACVGGRYVLGPASIEQADAARAMMQRVRGYSVAVVQEGDDLDVRALRDLLGRVGFRPLQRSVWIGARTTDDRLGAALRRARLDRSVLVFHADEVDAGARARLAAAWQLDERRAELTDFHRLLMRFLAPPGLDADEAAWRCIEAAPVWYRVAVLGEPPFPLDLCGADHPLDRLNAEWGARLEATTDGLAHVWTDAA